MPCPVCDDKDHPIGWFDNLNETNKKRHIQRCGNSKANLCDQLTDLAQLSFLLLIIYRKHGTAFMTKDLYCDIQSAIQDAHVSVAIAQKTGFNGKMLLYMLGTDEV